MSQSRPPLAYATPNQAQYDLSYIASKQKGLILCILAYIVFVVIQFVVPPELRLIPALLAFAASITGVVFVFMLSIKIYNTAVGIILGILTLIPLLGLIVLLVVNSKATNILKANGVPVGFLGAKHVPPAI